MITRQASVHQNRRFAVVFLPLLSNVRGFIGLVKMIKLILDKRKPIIHTDDGDLKIIIPASRKYFLDLFIAFCVMGWGFGEIVFLGLLFSSSGSKFMFILTVLVLWTVVGAFAIVAWLWNFKRKEIVKISKNKLFHIRDFFIYKDSNEYDIKSVKTLRLIRRNLSILDPKNFLEYWGFIGGSIAFDYEDSIVSFAAGLDEADAKHVIETINDRHKNL